MLGLSGSWRAQQQEDPALQGDTGGGAVSLGVRQTRSEVDSWSRQPTKYVRPGRAGVVVSHVRHADALRRRGSSLRR